MKTAAVISYSSYHNAFIDRCIEEAYKVADYVIVVSYDTFFDGEKDTELKRKLDVDQHKVFGDWNKFGGLPSRFHHNRQRQAGYELLPKGFDMVFFIDSDEILEGERAKEWLKTVDTNESYKLAHFWYYRDTCYRADQVEEGAVLVSNKLLESKEMNWHGSREREDFTKDWNYKASYQNKVLGHHYSWAGTKEMMLRKVSSWGHNQDDVNWKSMVEQEFSHPFDYTCPFKPYTFTKIEPYIDFTFNE